MTSLIPDGFDEWTEQEQTDYTWLVEQQARNMRVSPEAFGRMSPRVLHAATNMYMYAIESGDKNE
jgi:hypothetical protein